MELKIKKITRRIILAEAIFVIGVLFYLFFSTAPNQVYPLSGMAIIDNDFNFEIENGERIILSSDKEFTNPIILKEGSDITLPPGVYYWKVKGFFRESEIMNFTIHGHVALDLDKRNENYELKNIGNVDLNVTRKKQGFTSDIILGIDELKEVEKDNSTYEGEQI